MKLFFLAVLFFSVSVISKAQIVTQVYRVNGNCDICKKTIETSCYAEKGIKKAKWNADSLALTISFDTTKTNREKILQRVAAAGYDTELTTADDAAYTKLHSCCQYDRKMLAVKKEK